MKHINLQLLIFFLFLSITGIQAQCVEESHSPFRDQGWFSCNKSISIIPERGINHWIMYDLGYTYSLEDMILWNHNVWGEIGMGAKSIIIDYSTDATNWTTVGPIDIAQAPGSWKYKTTENINLEGVICRYLMITVIETWDDDADCAGIAEIKINVDFVINSEDILEDSYSIFPNPASDFIQIELDGLSEITQVSIYNAVGQVVNQYTFPADDQMRIDIQDLRPGMYHIALNTAQGKVSKSFVKM